MRIKPQQRRHWRRTADAAWRVVADTLDWPTEVTRCQTVFPSARAYRAGPKHA